MNKYMSFFLGSDVTNNMVKEETINLSSTSYLINGTIMHTYRVSTLKPNLSGIKNLFKLMDIFKRIYKEVVDIFKLTGSDSNSSGHIRKRGKDLPHHSILRLFALANKREKYRSPK